jgi:predicted P-loop ATPase
VIGQVKAFLNERYAFRRNTMLDRLEIKGLLPDSPIREFRAMETTDLNTIFTHMSEAGISYSLNNLRSVIDSDYTPSFDPVHEYFGNLPAWDGTTDYLGQLADTIQTTDQEYWRRIFPRWITGMVVCAMGARNVNQQVLLIQGDQGKGKSTWIRNLLPPALREYYRNGMIDTNSKDDMMMLSTRMLINMEEFEGVKPADVPALKRVITQEGVTLRKPYDIQSKAYPRRASFVGSTNCTQFLSDISGSRRFLVVQALEIDYRTKIDYTGLYSQICHLIRNGFQYWFDGEEINEINTRNERHRMKDPLEENLYVFFQRATPLDYMVRWKPAAAILTHLSVFSKTLANAQTQQVLIQILERDRFMKRMNPNGIMEYGVVVLTFEEMEENSKRAG